MEETVYQVYKESSGEIVEKKSRFIGEVFSVSTVESAMAKIGEVKKRYYDAKHHCFAYILSGSRGERFSDDGEPSGTAGKPIMDVISGRHLENALIVVTRYFGGTLLGTGGLTRAYSLAAKEALSGAVLIQSLSGIRGNITLQYDLYGKIEKLLEKSEGRIMATEFTQEVNIDFIINKDRFEGFSKELTAISNGGISIAEPTDINYGMAEGKVILLQ